MLRHSFIRAILFALLAITFAGLPACKGVKNGGKKGGGGSGGGGGGDSSGGSPTAGNEGQHNGDEDDGRPVAPVVPPRPTVSPEPSPDTRTATERACEPRDRAPTAARTFLDDIRDLALSSDADRVAKAAAARQAIGQLADASVEAKKALMCVIHFSTVSRNRTQVIPEPDALVLTRLLIETKHVPTNTKDADNVPLVVNASRAGHPRLVTAFLFGLGNAAAKAQFLKENVDPTTGETALMAAAGGSKLEVVNTILSETANNVPLIGAVGTGRLNGLNALDIAGRQWQISTTTPATSEDTRRAVFLALLRALPATPTDESRAILNGVRGGAGAPGVLAHIAQGYIRDAPASHPGNSARLELGREFVARGGNPSAVSTDQIVHGDFITALRAESGVNQGNTALEALVRQMVEQDNPAILRARRRPNPVPATDKGPLGTADLWAEVTPVEAWGNANTALIQAEALRDGAADALFEDRPNGFPADPGPGPARLAAVRGFCQPAAPPPPAVRPPEPLVCADFNSKDQAARTARTTRNAIRLPDGVTAQAAQLLMKKKLVYDPADKVVEKADQAQNDLTNFLRGIQVPASATSDQITDLQGLGTATRRTSELAVAGARMAQVLSNYVRTLDAAALTDPRVQQLAQRAVALQRAMEAITNATKPASATDPSVEGSLKKAARATNKAKAGKKAFNDLFDQLKVARDTLAGLMGPAAGTLTAVTMPTRFPDGETAAPIIPPAPVPR